MFSTASLIIIIVVAQTAYAATYSQKSQLETDLLANYNLNILPLKDQSDRQNVTLSGVIYSVTDVDPIKGVVSLTMGFPCMWLDEMIVWNTSDYGGVQTMLLKQEQAWTPSVTLASTLDQTVIGEKNYHKIKYDASGRATWSPHHNLRLLCTFYMKYWPFDKHVCELVMLTIDHPSFELTMIPSGMDFSMVSISEWVLEDVVLEPGNPTYFSVISYIFKFKRNPAFYVLTLILPITLIGLLLPFVFLLPSDSGERIGFSITIMLSLTVFLTVISDEIPRTTNPVALICGFIMMLTISSVIVCILTILNLRLHHRSDKKPVGKYWRVLCRCNCNSKKLKFLDMILNRKGNAVEDISSQDKKQMSITVLDTEKNGDLTELYMNETKDDVQEDERCDCTWQDISKTLDKYLFIGTAVIVTIPSAVYICYLAMASDYLSDSE